MATIHRTTMVPGKLDLLGNWLPEQPWYRGTGRPPLLSRAGGFRLDDPAGEVGIEFVFVTDGRDGEETTYHVPMAYRGAPLPEAEEGLLGTAEHGVLGRRWIYDAAHDPVAIAQLLEFIGGRVDAQHQNRSDTLDPSVGRSWTGTGSLALVEPLQVANAQPDRTTITVSDQHVLDFVRVLRDVPDEGLGHVEADWTRPDGTVARGRIAVVR